MLVLIFSVAATWVLLAIGVGIDAESSDRPAFTWFFVVLLSGVVGVLIYIATRPSETAEELEERVSELEREKAASFSHCPQCGSALDGDQCPDCAYGRAVDRAEESDGESPQSSPFLKSVQYVVPVVLLAIPALFGWYAILSGVAPYHRITGPQYDVNKSIYNGLMGMAMYLTVSVSFAAVYLIRFAYPDSRTTDIELGVVTSFSLLLFVLSLSQLGSLLSLVYTTDQAIATGGLLIVHLLSVTGPPVLHYRSKILRAVSRVNRSLSPT